VSAERSARRPDTSATCFEPTSNLSPMHGSIDVCHRRIWRVPCDHGTRRLKMQYTCINPVEYTVFPICKFKCIYSPSIVQYVQSVQLTTSRDVVSRRRRRSSGCGRIIAQNFVAQQDRAGRLSSAARDSGKACIPREQFPRSILVANAPRMSFVLDACYEDAIRRNCSHEIEA